MWPFGGRRWCFSSWNDFATFSGSLAHKPRCWASREEKLSIPGVRCCDHNIICARPLEKAVRSDRTLPTV